MHATIEIGSGLPVELRLKGAESKAARSEWACLRLLDEDEIVDLLQDRLGKSEAEVRQVLETYHRPASCA